MRFAVVAFVREVARCYSFSLIYLSCFTRDKLTHDFIIGRCGNLRNARECVRFYALVVARV